MIKYLFLVATTLVLAAGAAQAGGGTVDPNGNHQHIDAPAVDTSSTDAAGRVASR